MPPVIGLLGGTFDPVHYGHLALAKAALASGAVHHIRWIPAGQPPHRSGPQASAEHRLEMVRLMIAGHPDFTLDDGEVIAAAHGQASYTFLTLQRLRVELGDAQPLALILGADAFLGLPTWYRWKEILLLTHLLVTTRPGISLDNSQMPDALREAWHQRHTGDPTRLATQPGGLIYPFEMAPHHISATAIRQCFAQRKEVETDLPASIIDYIRDRHLYHS